MAALRLGRAGAGSGAAAQGCWGCREPALGGSDVERLVTGQSGQERIFEGYPRHGPCTVCWWTDLVQDPPWRRLAQWPMLRRPIPPSCPG